MVMAAFEEPIGEGPEWIQADKLGVYYVIQVRGWLRLGWWQLKWYEVDNFKSYVGSRINRSWDLGVGRGLEGEWDQGWLQHTDLSNWKDDSAIYWERKHFWEDVEREGEDEFDLAMLNLLGPWGS